MKQMERVCILTAHGRLLSKAKSILLHHSVRIKGCPKHWTVWEKGWRGPRWLLPGVSGTDKSTGILVQKNQKKNKNQARNKLQQLFLLWWQFFFLLFHLSAIISSTMGQIHKNLTTKDLFVVEVCSINGYKSFQQHKLSHCISLFLSNSQSENKEKI